jgi:hypothetical protein
MVKGAMEMEFVTNNINAPKHAKKNHTRAAGLGSYP